MSDLLSPPFVTGIEGIVNFRDIGGYPIAPASPPTPISSPHPAPSSANPSPNPGRHRSVRRGSIYRCARPDGVTPTGLLKLRELGITTIFDLRSLPELRKLEGGVEGIQAWEKRIEEYGIKRVFAPAFEEEDYSPEKIALRYKDYARGGPEGFTRAYADILAHAGPSFKVVFEWVRDCVAKGEACVVHCTAGKDRTGILVALLLGLIGVRDEVVAEEYEWSQVGLREWRSEMRERLLRVEELEGNREGVGRMIEARKENMLAVLEMVREKYGGAEGYVRDCCGMSEEDMKTIRDNLTADVEPML